MSPMVKTPLTTEHALLGFLHQQPLHGYEIHRRLTDSKRLGRVWWLPQNKLYAVLNKLEREGYVSTQVEPQPNRPSRKVFSLTAVGREAYLDWLHRPVKQGRKIRLEFLLKLYFVYHLGRKQTVDLLDQQRAACREWLLKEREQAQVTAGPSPDQQYNQLVHQFRIGQMEAMLDWLNLCHQTFTDQME